MSPLDPEKVRADIPLLRRTVHGRTITYLDAAATSPTPQPVLDAMDRYYANHHANVHRGVYVTAEEATRTYEDARQAVGELIGAPHPREEVIFTKNTTEGFNLLAHAWGRHALQRGDVIVLSEMEHHANLVPWFQLRAERGIELRFLRVTDDFRLDLSDLDRTLDNARLVSVTAMSNVLGTVTPLVDLANAAHRHGALLAVDGAQLVARYPVDVDALGLDVLIFGAHKMMGPTGIGAVWARRDLLAGLPPFLGGGGMIADVTLDGFTPAPDVSRFEAGTPPIAEAAGFRAAVAYLSELGLAEIAAHESALTALALQRLDAEFGEKVRVIGPSDMTDRGGVLALDVAGVHAHDVAQVLDEVGVCVRPGHHCAKPLHRRFNLTATARVSFGAYSLPTDLDPLCEGLDRALALFGR